MKFAIVSIHSQVYDQLASITWGQNRLLYAERHGYDAVVQTSGFKGMQMGFAKIALIKSVLEQADHDAVFWTGADTLITNFTIGLHEFIYDNKHITIATDFNGLQSDSFIVRNTNQGREWINMILEKMPEYLHHPYFEQGAMMDTFPQAESIIKVVPQKFLNSFQYDIYIKNFGALNSLDRLGFNGNWTKGDFLIHFPALPNNIRVELCNEYLKHVVY